jgi:tetratricopeptide (TPR) repeat protein
MMSANFGSLPHWAVIHAVMNTNEAETIELAERSIYNGIRQGTRGLYEDAINTFDRAVVACQTFNDSYAVRLLAAWALGNKGAALGDFQRNSEAVACYDAAIAIYRQLAGQSGSSDLRWITKIDEALFPGRIMADFVQRPVENRVSRSSAISNNLRKNEPKDRINTIDFT